MLTLSVTPNIDDAPWRDLKENRTSIINVDAGRFELAGMPDEYGEGKSGVAMRIDLADGRTVIVQTTLQLFLNAARILEAKYPDEALGPRMSDEQINRIQGLILQQMMPPTFAGQRCEVCGEPATLALGGTSAGVELPIRYRCGKHHIDAEIDS